MSEPEPGARSTEPRDRGDLDLAHLLAAARQGDREALSALLDGIRSQLTALAREYADPRHLSQSVSDLVQETELRVWQHLDQFCGGGEDAETLAMFRSWVGQILNRLGLNRVRKRQALRRQPGDDRKVWSLFDDEDAPRSRQGDSTPGRIATPSEEYAVEERATRIRAAISRLADPVDRQLLLCRFFEGQSLEEVARSLDISYEQVRYRLRLTLAKLQQELDNLD